MAAKAASIDPARATKTGEPSSLTIIHTARPIRASDAPIIMPTSRRIVDAEGFSDMTDPS